MMPLYDVEVAGYALHDVGALALVVALCIWAGLSYRADLRRARGGVR